MIKIARERRSVLVGACCIAKIEVERRVLIPNLILVLNNTFAKKVSNIPIRSETDHFVDCVSIDFSLTCQVVLPASRPLRRDGLVWRRTHSSRPGGVSAVLQVEILS